MEPAQQEWRKTGAKWAGTFLKLALFKLRQFERVLFVDGDTLAVGPIHASWLHSHVQLSMDRPIAGSYDISNSGNLRPKGGTRTFNSGVMLIRPSLRQYERLIRALRSARANRTRYLSEQPFLNAAFSVARPFSSNFSLLPLSFAVNMAAFVVPSVWRRALPLTVVHFTMNKPFGRGGLPALRSARNGTGSCASKFQPLCELWWDAEDRWLSDRRVLARVEALERCSKQQVAAGGVGPISDKIRQPMYKL